MKKAEVKNIEVKEATTKYARILVSYSYVPVGGREPVSNRQEIGCKKWEKGGHKRIYIKGYNGDMGYWDISKNCWCQVPTRAGFLEDVIKAVVETAIAAITEEEKRIEKLQATK